MSADYLPIAVRAYTERAAGARDDEAPSRPRSAAVLPNGALVLDTETTTGATQRLTFGSYRYLRLDWGGDTPAMSCVEEGFFYGDDLPRQDPEGLAILRNYSVKHPADVVPGVDPHLRLLSRREFVQAVVYPALLVQATLVMFNLLFDITRVARDVKPARGTFEGGFSVSIWEYQDERGIWRENKYRPRMTIKTIDSKRAIKRLVSPRKVDDVDLVPYDADDETPQLVAFGGRLLDLRQVVYALTDKSHSLESACKTFGIPYVKPQVRHGLITPEYIAYNRGDAWATAELYLKVMVEFIKCCPSA